MPLVLFLTSHFLWTDFCQYWPGDILYRTEIPVSNTNSFRRFTDISKVWIDINLEGH